MKNALSHTHAKQWKDLSLCAVLFASLTAIPLQAQNLTTPFAPTAAHGSNHVSGSVLDASGAAIPGADVTLTKTGESQGRSTTTGADGTFTFDTLPPGSYIIDARANGFQIAVSDTFALAPHQTVALRPFVLLIAQRSEEVLVRPTEVVAAEQIKAEEKQRLVGIIPDFYTSYVWNAAPLTTQQKFSLLAHERFDPVTLVGLSVSAGFEQATNAYPGFGQGPAGYSKRWGALFADSLTSDALSKAVFPSLFHQDPRYFYQGSGSTWSRVGHALSSVVVVRSDSGRPMPNYAYLFGNVSSGAISNLYYPSSSRGVGLILTNALIGLAGHAGDNLFHEFLYRHLTTHVSGNGEPEPSTSSR